MSKKMIVQLIIGVVITAVVVYFSIVLLKELKMNVQFPTHVNWWFVVVAVAIYMYSNYIRGLAYSKGIAPDMDNMTSLGVIAIGHALNMVLPVHAGEGRPRGRRFGHGV
jgi:undecaprenyl pyrophosphate phosphatase UppP